MNERDKFRVEYWQKMLKKKRYHKLIKKFMKSLNYYTHLDYKNWSCIMPVVEEIEKLKVSHPTVGETTPNFRMQGFQIAIEYHGGMLNYMYNVNGQPIQIYFNEPHYGNLSRLEAMFLAVGQYLDWHYEMMKFS